MGDTGRMSKLYDLVKIANRSIYMVPRDGIEPPTRGFSVRVLYYIFAFYIIDLF